MLLLADRDSIFGLSTVVNSRSNSAGELDTVRALAVSVADVAIAGATVAHVRGWPNPSWRCHWWREKCERIPRGVVTLIVVVCIFY